MAESRGDVSQSSGFKKGLSVPRYDAKGELIELLKRQWRPYTFWGLLAIVLSFFCGLINGMTGMNPLILLFLCIPIVGVYLILGGLVHSKLPLISPFSTIPKRAVLEVHTPRLKSAAVEVRNSWPQIAVNAHLASSVFNVRDKGPHLRAIKETPAGLEFYVSVVPGEDAMKLIEAAPNIASAMEVSQLLTAENNHLLVKFVIPSKNAMDETVELSSVLNGRCENDALVESLNSSEKPNLMLGVTGLSEAVTIPLKVQQHIGLQGMTRSGKSVGLYSLLGQFRSIPYIQITGIDPTGALPSRHDQIPWVIGGGKGITPASVARWLDQIEDILSTRLLDLRKSHYLDKFDYDDPEHPLIVVVFEEYPGVLASLKLAEAGVKPADRVLDRLKAVFSRLLMESLKVNIRCVVVAQRADAEFLGGAQRSQLGARISFKVEDQAAVDMFHPGMSGTEWNTLKDSQAGTAIVHHADQPRTMFRAFNIGFLEYRELAGPMPELEHEELESNQV